MNDEQLKKERMKIAYNLLQGFAAFDGEICSIKYNVSWAYKVADEVLKQGGYTDVD